ncbi:MAG: phytanoyl-CoA dioxygenase family protein [Planctomycetota bacterium]|nr:phytanoyl-CoA dioxygenase family protein [Planctomycetota bacterium]
MLKKYLFGAKSYFRLHLDRIRNFKGKVSEIEYGKEQGGIVDSWISSLNENGFVVVEDFFDPKLCQESVTNLDSILDEHHDDCWKDPLNSDNRMFGINFKYDVAEQFLKNSLFSETVCRYMNWQSLVGYTMVNRVIHRENNPGSGGGWHRDSARYRDLKFILYLTDVSTENGPFQYVRQSNNISERTKLILKYGSGFAGKRFNDETAKIVESLEDNCELTGKAGTLIIADTSGIHRGKPLTAGKRFALTNYYWQTAAEVPPRMTEIVPDFFDPKLETILG